MVFHVHDVKFYVRISVFSIGGALISKHVQHLFNDSFTLHYFCRYKFIWTAFFFLSDLDQNYLYTCVHTLSCVLKLSKTFNVGRNVQIPQACGSTTSSILPRVLGRPREETTQHALSKICFSSMKYDDPFKHVANTISIQGCNAHCLCILTWIPFCFEEHLPATCLLHRFDITWRSCGFKYSMIVGNNTTCNECFRAMIVSSSSRSYKFVIGAFLTRLVCQKMASCFVLKST